MVNPELPDWPFIGFSLSIPYIEFFSKSATRDLIDETTALMFRRGITFNKARGNFSVNSTRIYNT